MTESLVLPCPPVIFEYYSYLAFLQFLLYVFGVSLVRGICVYTRSIRGSRARGLHVLHAPFWGSHWVLSEIHLLFYLFID